MRTGIVILNVAALVWLSAGLGALDAPLWAYGLPVALSILVAALSLARAHEPAVPPEVARRIGRTVGLWSTIEAILIALAVAVLVRLGRPDLIGPAVALIVGLHFLPLARALRLPPYDWTAAGLILVSIAALALPVAPALAIAGIGAAAVLYATSLALARGRGQAYRHSPGGRSLRARCSSTRGSRRKNARSGA
jgi:hypothetical protein